jgi:flagellar basal body-associated protein FliL
MSVNALLSTIILVSFIVTVILAVGSYMAYKVREHRRPTARPGEPTEPVFFERFFPRRAEAAQPEAHEERA